MEPNLSAHTQNHPPREGEQASLGSVWRGVTPLKCLRASMQQIGPILNTSPTLFGHQPSFLSKIKNKPQSQNMTLKGSYLSTTINYCNNNLTQWHILLSHGRCKRGTSDRRPFGEWEQKGPHLATSNFSILPRQAQNLKALFSTDHSWKRSPSLYQLTKLCSLYTWGRPNTLQVFSW